MKLIFGVLVLALISSVVVANITSDQEYVLNHSGYAAQKAGLGTLINKTPNMLIAKYSYAVQGGSTTADISLLTDLGNPLSYAVLPDNAVVKNAWLEILTQPTSGGSNVTVAVKSESAGDLFAATSIGALPTGGIRQGVPAGTTTTFIKLTADRTVKATVAKSTAGQASPLTAGKFNVYIDYVIGD